MNEITAFMWAMLLLLLTGLLIHRRDDGMEGWDFYSIFGMAAILIGLVGTMIELEFVLQLCDLLRHAAMKIPH